MGDRGRFPGFEFHHQTTPIRASEEGPADPGNDRSSLAPGRGRSLEGVDNATGRIDVTDDGATITLARRTSTPVLFQAGFAELDLSIPWWGYRRLWFRFL